MLQESSAPHIDLDIAMESIIDGNIGNAREHMLRLMRDEISQIENEKMPISLIRFSGIANNAGFLELKEDIRLGRITLSNPFKFNDPMDPILKVWIELQKDYSWNKNHQKFFAIALKSLKNLRVCCLSDINRLGDKLPLMWSHYADNHKGIAIKYRITTDMLKCHNDEGLFRLCKIAYREHKEMSNNISIDNALLAKGACWEYEAEHRLFYFSTNDNDFKEYDNTTGKTHRKDFIPFEGFTVEAVYLGTRIDSHKEVEIRSIAKKTGINVFKMKYDNYDITKLVSEQVD